jgi:hypothetical protein
MIKATLTLVHEFELNDLRRAVLSRAHLGIRDEEDTRLERQFTGRGQFMFDNPLDNLKLFEPSTSEWLLYIS